MGNQRPVDLSLADRCLVAWLVLFAFTSWVMEMYIVLRVDLATCRDPLGRAFHFYASRWDPVFLDPPVFLWLMCCVDAFVFGSCYLALIFGFVRRRTWVKPMAIAYAAAIVYSTIIYFGFELLTQADQADLLMVTVVNAPYVLVPMWLVIRVLRQPLFGLQESPPRQRATTLPDIEL